MGVHLLQKSHSKGSRRRSRSWRSLLLSRHRQKHQIDFGDSLRQAHHREETGAYFMQRLKKAATTIGQISTDGWGSYPGLIDLLWGDHINYGQIVKIIGSAPVAVTRYSPGAIKEVRRKRVIGNPKIDRISTSIAERMNLSIRMSVRRMTRLTNGFSKKWSNHECMMELFFGVYNFCKVHGSTKTSPAVAAGITDHVWTVRELIEKTGLSNTQTH
jgi:IS1 family transposase